MPGPNTNKKRPPAGSNLKTPSTRTHPDGELKPLIWPKPRKQNPTGENRPSAASKKASQNRASKEPSQPQQHLETINEEILGEQEDVSQQQIHNEPLSLEEKNVFQDQDTSEPTPFSKHLDAENETAPTGKRDTSRKQASDRPGSAKRNEISQKREPDKSVLVENDAEIEDVSQKQTVDEPALASDKEVARGKAPDEPSPVFETHDTEEAVAAEHHADPGDEDYLFEHCTEFTRRVEHPEGERATIVFKTINLKHMNSKNEDMMHEMTHFKLAEGYHTALKAVKSQGGNTKTALALTDTSTQNAVWQRVSGVTNALRMLEIESTSLALFRLCEKMGTNFMAEEELAVLLENNHGAAYLLHHSIGVKELPSCGEILELLEMGNPRMRELVFQLAKICVDSSKLNKVILYERIPLVAWFYQVVFNVYGYETKAVFNHYDAETRNQILETFNDVESDLFVFIMTYDVTTHGMMFNEAYDRVLIGTPSADRHHETEIICKSLKACQHRPEIFVTRPVVVNSHDAWIHTRSFPLEVTPKVSPFVSVSCIADGKRKNDMWQTMLRRTKELQELIATEFAEPAHPSSEDEADEPPR